MTDTNTTPNNGDVTEPLPVQEPPAATSAPEYAAAQPARVADTAPWYRTGGGIAAIAVASALVASTFAFAFGWSAHGLATAIHGPRGFAMMSPSDRFDGPRAGQGGPGMGFRGGPGGRQGMGRPGAEDRFDCPRGFDRAPQDGQGFGPGQGRGRGWNQAPDGTAPATPQAAPQGSSWSF